MHVQGTQAQRRAFYTTQCKSTHAHTCVWQVRFGPEQWAPLFVKLGVQQWLPVQRTQIVLDEAGLAHRQCTAHASSLRQMALSHIAPAVEASTPQSSAAAGAAAAAAGAAAAGAAAGAADAHAVGLESAIHANKPSPAMASSSAACASVQDAACPEFERLLASLSAALRSTPSGMHAPLQQFRHLARLMEQQWQASGFAECMRVPAMLLAGAPAPGCTEGASAMCINGDQAQKEQQQQQEQSGHQGAEGVHMASGGSRGHGSIHVLSTLALQLRNSAWLLSDGGLEPARPDDLFVGTQQHWQLLRSKVRATEQRCAWDPIIGFLCVSTTIGILYVSSIKRFVCVSAIKGFVHVSTIIGFLHVSSIIGFVCVSSIVGFLCVSAIIGFLCVSSIIGFLCVSTIIGFLCVSTIIGFLRMSAIVGFLCVSTSLKHRTSMCVADENRTLFCVAWRETSASSIWAAGCTAAPSCSQPMTHVCCVQGRTGSRLASICTCI